MSASLETLTRTGGRLEPELIGTNRASTFYGFCASHDSQTFAPLEARPFVASDEQLFLLAYRPLVKEMYLKESTIASMNLLRDADRGKPLHEQFRTQSFLAAMNAGTQAAASRLRTFKAKLDAELLASDYKQIRACIIYFDHSPDLVGSGVVQPEWDFQGIALQDPGNLDLNLDWTSFTLLPTVTGGAAVFSWHADAEQAVRSLVDSLLAFPQARIPDAIVRLSFEAFENIFMSPAWWNTLPPAKQKVLKRRAMSGLPSTATARLGLVEDDLEFVEWRVQRIERRY